MEKYVLNKGPVAVLILALLLNPLNAYCWGVTGHQTVALIAESQLTPETRREIKRLLALEPGSTLQSIASWADQNRDPGNTRWHYINFPRNDCHYVKERDCPNGQCVVEAIKVQHAILHSAAPDAERLLALKFLVHLVGDIHQPLHAGFGDDRGGNHYQIQFRAQGSNLHALWDNDMVDQFELRPAALAHLIASSHQIHTVSSGPTDWAEQSCQIVLQAGFYPGHHVTEDYLREYAPVVQLQLLKAGTRLASLLNH